MCRNKKRHVSNRRYQIVTLVKTRVLEFMKREREKNRLEIGFILDYKNFV